MFFSSAKADNPQAHTAPVSLEHTSIPTFPLLSAVFAVVCTVALGGLWVGKLQAKVTQTEEDVEGLSVKLNAIQHTLDGLNDRMENCHRQLRKEILEEIRKEILRSESNIDSSFQTPFLRLEMQLNYLTKALDARNQTLNQLKSAVNRIGSEAREAKSLAHLLWEMNGAAPDGPPTRPGRRV